MNYSTVIIPHKHGIHLGAHCMTPWLCQRALLRGAQWRGRDKPGENSGCTHNNRWICTRVGGESGGGALKMGSRVEGHARWRWGRATDDGNEMDPMELSEYSVPAHYKGGDFYTYTRVEKAAVCG